MTGSDDVIVVGKLPAIGGSDLRTPIDVMDDVISGC